MKRKHSQSSPQTGCQIISKFFKSSERQDVSNASKLMQNTGEPNKSQTKKYIFVEPVLQKLTRLREALIKNGGLFKNVHAEDESKEGKMDHKNPLKNHDNLDKPGNFSSVNTTTECHDRESSKSQNSGSSDNSQANSKVVGRITDVDIHLENNDAGNDFLTIDTVSDENIIDTDVQEDCDITETEGQDSDIREQTLMQRSLQGMEDSEINDSELMDESEASLMDRNTEGNLGDDEDDEDEPQVMDNNSYFTDDVLTNSKQNLECVSEKLSTFKSLTQSKPAYDSQSSQESTEKTDFQEIDDSDSDSDDDLLTPPSFLCESKMKAENLLRTPEKLTTPVGASPLCSPVKPARDMKVVLDDRKYRLSLQQMLKDRSRKEAKNIKMVKIEADLDAGIKKGGVKTMTTIISEDDTDTDVDDGKDLSKCKLPKEVSKHLVTVSNFSDEFSGEDIFPEFHKCALDTDLPQLDFSSPLHDDQFVQNLSSSKPCEIKELICGGWFMQYHLKRPCPAILAKWVFNIMTCYPDVYLSGHCYKTLWALLRAAYQDTNGIPKGIRGINWVPSVKNITYVLQYYGATMETLIPKDVTSSGVFPHTDITTKDNKKPDISRPSNCAPQLVFLIKQLVQLLTHALHYANYMENDLPVLLVIMCRLSLDLRLQELLFDLEMCICEILNCFGRAQWEDQITTLPSLLVNISNNHRNLLHIMQVIPPSARGSILRQLTCMALVKIFVKELNVDDIKLGRERIQGFCKTETFEISELSSLVEGIKPKQNPSCDYHLLHTIIFLVGLAIGNQDYPSATRADLKTLANKLNSLNGEIKDPRAKFLDRTKVKDMIVRTIHKIQCLVQSIEPAKEKQLTEYFEVNSSDYVVQQLQESTTFASSYEEASSPENDNASSPEGISTPDPLSGDEDPLMTLK